MSDNVNEKVVLHPKEKERQEVDKKFQKLGHPPDDGKCNHRQWSFKEHGRVCPCGTWMMDFGD